MTEAEWLACVSPDLMFEMLREGATVRRLALLSVASCRSNRYLMKFKRERKAVEYAERVIEGVSAADEDGPSDRDCYLMASAANHCMAVAWYVRDNDLASAIRYTGRILEAITDGGANSSRGERRIAVIIRDIFGNPFRPVALTSAWRTLTVLSLAGQMYDSRDFCPMPILADALQDAGCENDEVLAHCRSDGAHVRGCWVVDLLLGKT
ncbi:MAG: hypothetical protein JWO38_4446 [Gemmataceae bacterium]|nr:hypothetical protein [Gemmataceae bacterium]